MPPSSCLGVQWLRTNKNSLSTYESQNVSQNKIKTNTKKKSQFYNKWTENN